MNQTELLNSDDDEVDKELTEKAAAMVHERFIQWTLIGCWFLVSDPVPVSCLTS